MRIRTLGVLAALATALVAGCGHNAAPTLPSADRFAVIHPLRLGPRARPAPSRGPVILATTDAATKVVGLGSDGRTGRDLLDVSPPHDPHLIVAPSWSPDGRSFVATAQLTIRRWHAVVLDTTDMRHKTVRARLFDPGPPITFSPDGRYLLASGIRGARGIYAFDTARRQVIWVVDGPVAEGSSPSWSPDAERIAIDRENGGVAIANLRTRRVRLLTRDGNDAAWSPDGRWIAFTTHRGVAARRCGEDGCGPTTDVDVVHPDGTGRRRITHTQGDELQPSWTPDGKWLLAELYGGTTYYDSSTWLVTFRTDGSCYRTLGLAGPKSSLEVGPNAWRPGRRAPLHRCRT